MCIHVETAAAIAAHTPGYAQLTRADPSDVLSWHRHGFSETRLSGWDSRDARCALIDAWAQGKARVTPCTFSENQILHRAEEWQHGRGRHIARGHRDPDLAQRIRRLADPAKVGYQCSAEAPPHLTAEADRSSWFLWFSGQASTP